MKIELDKTEVKQWAKLRLAETSPSNRGRPFDDSNGLDHSTEGERQAWRDVISLMDLHGENIQVPMDEIYKNHVQDKSQDKSSGDSWWITGYEGVIKKLGMAINQKPDKRAEDAIKPE